MKDIVLVISLLLAVGLSVVVVRFAQKADKATRSLEEARYSRMVAEETLQKNDAKLATFEMQLKEDQDKMGQIAEILTQEKSINLSLKKQYDELTEAKSNLEAKLTAVLAQKQAAVEALKTQATVAVPASAASAPASAGMVNAANAAKGN